MASTSEPGEAVPRVSIVVPTFDEADWIEACLDSLGSQDYEAIVEILVVDGGSRDATCALVSARQAIDPRVRLLENPRRSAAGALNVGLRAAVGDVFVRADAHTEYATDYVRRCVEILLETGAENVGGPMVPVGTTRFGRAVAAVTTSRIGMGSGAFHWTRERRAVDTVYLGAFRMATLKELGGWDDTGLQWGAEDHELNFRLTARGGTILCDPSIRSWYSPRQTPRALARQYFNYGIGKVSTLSKHRRLPTLRPLAPAAFVALAWGGAMRALMARRPVYLAPVAAWLAVASSASARMASDDDCDAPRCVLALAICHGAYGTGFWVGIGRRLAGRGFDAAPSSR